MKVHRSISLWLLFVCFVHSIEDNANLDPKTIIQQIESMCKNLEKFHFEPTKKFSAALLKVHCPKVVEDYLKKHNPSSHFVNEYVLYCVLHPHRKKVADFCKVVYKSASKYESQLWPSQNITEIKVAYYDLACGKFEKFSPLIGGHKYIYHTEVEIGDYTVYFSRAGLMESETKRSELQKFSQCFLEEKIAGYSSLSISELQKIVLFKMKSYLE